MEKDAKEALQVAKEIVVKFIESGRVSPTNFSEIFPTVYQVVLETITMPVADARSRTRSDQGGPEDGAGQ
jgi:hypothetical protein